MGHVACMSEVKSVYRILAGYLKKTGRLGGGNNDTVRRVCGCGLHLKTSDDRMVQYVNKRRRLS